MPGVTPSSIEKQLAEYRQRKQEQEEERNRSAAVLASSNLSSPSPPPPPLILPRQTPWVVSLVYTSLQRVANTVSGVLYAAVAPDHLQLDHPTLNGGHTLREEVPPDASTVRRRIRPGMNPDEASSSLLGASDDTSTLIEDSDEDSDQSLETSGRGILSKIIRSRSRVSWATLFLKCLLWLILWKVFILWGFGAVYFLVSGFLCIGYNLRNGPRRPGEVSAYSVFNKDLRRIEGTVTPEQLQREMLFRM